MVTPLIILKRPNHHPKTWLFILGSMWILLVFQPQIILGLDEPAKSKEVQHLVDPKDAEIRGNVASDRIVIFGRNQKYEEEHELLVITGDPYILTNEDFISGETIRYYRKEDKVELVNHAKIRNFENRLIITGDKATYFLNTKNAQVNGNARMYSDSEKILMHCDNMIRNYETKEMLADGSIKVQNFKDGNQLFSDKANYNMETKNLVLEKKQNKPQVIYSGYHSFANKITYEVGNDLYILEGNASITGNSRDILADTIHIWQSPSVKADLKGNVKVTELGREGSVLPNEPVRIAQADAATYTYENQVDQFELHTNAYFIRYSIKPVDDPELHDEVRYIKEKQEGYADTIKYSAGTEGFVLLDGNAVIKQPNQVAMADSIQYEMAGEQKAVLKGRAIVLIGYNKKEIMEQIQDTYDSQPDLGTVRVDRIKYRAYADTITYYETKDEALLEGNARLKMDGNRTAEGDTITFTGKGEQKVVIVSEKGISHYFDAENDAKAKTITYYDRSPSVVILENQAALRRSGDDEEVDAEIIYFYGEVDAPERRAVLMGKPHIREQARTITGDLVEYFENYDQKVREATVVGNAYMNDVDKKQSIKADMIDYYGKNSTNESSFYFQGKVSFKDKEQTITCDKGEYHILPPQEGMSKSDEQAVLTGNIQFTENDRRMASDVLRYYKHATENDQTKDDRMLLIGDVTVNDQSTQIHANTIEVHNYTKIPGMDNDATQPSTTSPDASTEQPAQPTGQLGKPVEVFEFYLFGNPEDHGKIEFIQFGDAVKHGKQNKIAQKGYAYKGFYTFEEPTETLRRDHIVLTGDAILMDQVDGRKASGHRITIDISEEKQVEKTSTITIEATSLFTEKVEEPVSVVDNANLFVERILKKYEPKSDAPPTSSGTPDSSSSENSETTRDSGKVAETTAGTMLPIESTALTSEEAKISIPENSDPSSNATEDSSSTNSTSETSADIKTGETESSEAKAMDTNALKLAVLKAIKNRLQPIGGLVIAFTQEYLYYLEVLEESLINGILNQEIEDRLIGLFQSSGVDLNEALEKKQYELGSAMAVYKQEIHQLYRRYITLFPELKPWFNRGEKEESIHQDAVLVIFNAYITKELAKDYPKIEEWMALEDEPLKKALIDTQINMKDVENRIEKAALYILTSLTGLDPKTLSKKVGTDAKSDTAAATEGDSSHATGEAAESLNESATGDAGANALLIKDIPLDAKNLEATLFKKATIPEFFDETKIIAVVHQKRAWVKDDKDGQIIVGDKIVMKQHEEPPDTDQDDPVKISYFVQLDGDKERAFGIQRSEKDTLRISGGMTIQYERLEDKLAKTVEERGNVITNAQVKEALQFGQADQIKYVKLTKDKEITDNYVYFIDHVEFLDAIGTPDETKLLCEYVHYNQLTEYMFSYNPYNNDPEKADAIDPKVFLQRKPNVEETLTDEEKFDVTVEAEVMEFFQQRHEAFAKGDVCITHADSEVYGEWSRYKQQKENNLPNDFVEVLVNVKLVQGNNISFPKKVVYFLNKNLLSIQRGSAKLEGGGEATEEASAPMFDMKGMQLAPGELGKLKRP